MIIDRRNFLRRSAAVTLAAGLPDELIAQAATATAPFHTTELVRPA